MILSDDRPFGAPTPLHPTSVPSPAAEPEANDDAWQDAAREHADLMRDLGSDNEDYARSGDEGWFYPEND